MKTYHTLYGDLTQLIQYTLYSNNQLKECTLDTPHVMQTAYGDLIPQYTFAEVRKKYITSLSFYDCGSLKSIALETQTLILTLLGSFPAELLTFYKNGQIKKLFPLNGKLSGYWEENEEYTLAKPLSLHLPIGDFTANVSCISFYEDGSLKSLTLWPQEIIFIDTPLGPQYARSGLAFYSDGKLKSFEPAFPLKVKTPIGLVTAYDASPCNLYFDHKALVFTPEGSLESLLTSVDELTVVSSDNTAFVYAPHYQIDPDGESTLLSPLKISFEIGPIDEGVVCFDNTKSFSLKTSQFSISSKYKNLLSHCQNCSHSSQCSNCSP